MRASSVFATLLVLSGLALPAWADDVTPPPPPPPAATADQPPALPPLQQEQPPPLPPSANYFVAVNNQPVGPLSLQQVAQLVEAKQLSHTDLVWKSGTPTWVPADQIAEVSALFAGGGGTGVPAPSAWKDFLVGTWESSGQTAQGYSWVVRTQFNADGTYTGFQRLTMQGEPAGAIQLGGKWTVQPTGGEIFSLTISAPGDMPTTIVLKRINQNTLLNQNDGSEAHRVLN